MKDENGMTATPVEPIVSPFYDRDGITIYNADCRDVLPQLGKFDLLLTDPPYGTTEQRWDTVTDVWIAKRNMKDLGAAVITCAQPFTTDLINGNRDQFKYCWVWFKSQPGDCTNAKNKPMRSHEDIAVFSSGTTANGSQRQMPYFPQGLKKSGRRRTMGDNNPGRNGGTFKPARANHKPYTQENTNYPITVLMFDNERGVAHPTQKPVALMEYMILTYTQAGDSVLDPFMGSGTTLVAAKRAGRRAVGIEISEEYCRIAVERLRQGVLSFDSEG